MRPGERRVHELKTWPEPFQATLEGRKPFEIRKNDRDFKVGDELHLREFNPCGCDRGECRTGGYYTGRECRVLVTHIESWPSWGLPPQVVVMGIRSPLDDNELDDMDEAPTSVTPLQVRALVGELRHTRAHAKGAVDAV